MRLAEAAAREGAQAAVVVAGQARWTPAVLVDLVRDRVVDDARPVVGLSEAAPDRGGRSALSVRVACGQPPPVECPDHFGDADRFGVGGGE